MSKDEKQEAPLSKEDARKRMMEVAETAPRYSTQIEIDLPGWKGVLRWEVRPNDRSRPARHWRFQGGRNSVTFHNRNKKSQVLTESIIRMGSRWSIENYQDAVSDLGVPDKVILEADGMSALVRWSPFFGYITRATAFQEALRLDKVRWDGETNRVLADVLLIGGNWRLSDVPIARGEQFNPSTVTVEPSRLEDDFVNRLNPDDAQIVLSILRHHLLPLKWHQLQFIAESVGPDSRLKRRAAELALNLQFMPLETIQAELHVIITDYQDLLRIEGAPISYASKPNPFLYDEVTALEGLEITAFEEDNLSHLRVIKDWIDPFNSTVRDLPGERSKQKYRDALGAHLDKVIQFLQELPADAADVLDHIQRLRIEILVTRMLLKENMEIERILERHQICERDLEYLLSIL